MEPVLQVQQAGDVQAILERLGVLDDPPFQLLPVVVPIIQFERPDPSREDRFCIGFGSIIAGGALNGHVQLFNPVDSRVLVKPIAAIIVVVGAAANVEVRAYDSALTNDNPEKTFADRRIPGLPIAQVRDVGNAGALGNIFAVIAAPNTESIEIPYGEMVLDEGQGVLVNCATVNLAVYASYYWTETRK